MPGSDPFGLVLLRPFTRSEHVARVHRDWQVRSTTSIHTSTFSFRTGEQPSSWDWIAIKQPSPVQSMHGCFNSSQPREIRWKGSMIWWPFGEAVVDLAPMLNDSRRVVSSAHCVPPVAFRQATTQRLGTAGGQSFIYGFLPRNGICQGRWADKSWLKILLAYLL